MLSQLRARFWIEGTSAAVTLALALLTTVWQDWIEMVFGVDPDHHSGSLEWSIVAVLASIGLVLSLLARHEWVVATSRRETAEMGTAAS